ncbi:DUF2339 domain-containing protein [Flavilitoribacter nigricans]|uniref:DUF2339 domain-containing protein n=1 Tax=Flavilitoribacter nigricans (strain ATCC 23147 / DSM 23189 / NBRC 102662 / NCIMB 1420 / SS-2) TaxID=1122177 RepID=A0A2D0NC45_FLAN2|nr:DUF2339 domain-containing protein [Flavilitoribacter nigricans]PHN05759.1 hypothetical protein CRP01_14890 [Flavilitoribacter nigricans DSM 23189 = NBRC 102662]
MDQDPNKYEELTKKLDRVVHRQNELQREIALLRREIDQLHQPEEQLSPAPPPKISAKQQVPDVQTQAVPVTEAPETPPSNKWDRFRPSSRTGLDWEKFIGENLISKIGILITVIGIAFGAKYAIDHELISPLTRIVLGYLAGIALTGIAMRLKEKYEAFSAVLLSGGLAVLYIITYFAFNYYALMPQSIAFVLMALFTAFTVLAAWHYDRQIIALMGLVGAYGVPFLISEESGSATVLLGYMALINTGILVIAFKKYWKSLFSMAFWLTWLIFSWWMLFGYTRDQHFLTGFLFSTVFFLLFYGTILAYKLMQKETYRWTDILLLLSNSFIYFGFGYNMLEDHPVGADLLGVFAVANAAVHFGVGYLMHRDKLADRNLFYFIVGLVLVFLSIAVPIQLDGNWVTLLWAGEAALLFWLGRSRQIKAYEKMSLPVTILAFVSLLQDWSSSYDQAFYQDTELLLAPVFNIQFLSSLIVSGIFGLMVWMQNRKQWTSALPAGKIWHQGLRFAIPAVFLMALYFTFRVEIEYYFRIQMREALASMPESTAGSRTFTHLASIWVIYYSLVFLALLSLVNMRWIKDRILGVINLIMNAYGLFFFLAGGLFSLRLLDESYLLSDGGDVILTGGFTYLRYLGYLIVGGLLYITYRYQRMDFIPLKSSWPFDALLHLVSLFLLSNELIHLLQQAGVEDAEKLGLSIFWGIYALFLIALGIAHRKAYLRISAIVLFTITLIKLFFYDIAHLNTMSKTVVLMSLGVLLLLISFLYNKFKHLIADANEV